MSSASVGGASLDVREAATRDLSDEIPLKDAIMVAVAAGLGYGFDAYAVNLYGLILPTISVSLGFGSRTSGVIGSLFLVGYTVGTIGFGIAADRYGRRDTLGVSILLYGVTTSLGGIGSSTVFFTAMRFLTGVGGAGELAVGAPYTCEMYKRKHRALGTGGIMFSLYSLGYVLAGVAALFLTPHWGWRAVFLIAIVPAVAVFIFRRLIRESVRYVVEKAEDKFEAARTVLALHGDVSPEHQAKAFATTAARSTFSLEASPRLRQRTGAAYLGVTIVMGGLGLASLFVGLLAPLASGIAAALVTAGVLGVLLTMSRVGLQAGGKYEFLRVPLVRRRVGIGWLLYTANAMGYWALSTFLTTFMVTKFGVSPREAIVYAIIFYGAQFFVSYLGTGLSDRVGRRPAGIGGALIMIVATVIAAESSTLSMFLVFGGIQIAMLGWLWGIGDTYLSELFPTSIRGSCFGIGTGGGRTMSIAAPFLVGAGIAAFGPTTPFLATAGLWVLTIVAYLIGPETARKPLEQIEAEFAAEASSLG